MIKLNPNTEVPILYSILEYPSEIIQVPRECYDKFHKYLIQEERYEDILTLESIEDKIVDKTLNEMMNELFPGLSQFFDE